jgi:hypothetical protein
MPQAQTGSLKSTPKITRINGDDNLKMIYRNLGNNHAYPFVWGQTVTHSGTTTLVASGVEFHGYELASNCNITATPIGDAGGNGYWIEKDAVNNIVNIRSTSSLSNVDFDLKFIIGVDPEITGIFCRGNTGAVQSLP